MFEASTMVLSPAAGTGVAGSWLLAVWELQIFDLCEMYFLTVSVRIHFSRVLTILSVAL